MSRSSAPDAEAIGLREQSLCEAEGDVQDKKPGFSSCSLEASRYSAYESRDPKTGFLDAPRPDGASHRRRIRCRLSRPIAPCIQEALTSVQAAGSAPDSEAVGLREQSLCEAEGDGGGKVCQRTLRQTDGRSGRQLGALGRRGTRPCLSRL